VARSTPKFAEGGRGIAQVGFLYKLATVTTSLTPLSLVYLPTPTTSSANSYAGTTTLTDREVVWFDHQAKPRRERGLGNRITKDLVISLKHTVKAPVSFPPGQLDPPIQAGLAGLAPHLLV
jgi:hypothetical protein